jgi:riboflavin biosynthesis pyrimidine reductase
VVVDGIVVDVVVVAGRIVDVVDDGGAAAPEGEQETRSSATRRKRRIRTTYRSGCRFRTSATRRMDHGAIASGGMIREKPGGDGIDPLDLQMSLRRGRSDRPWVMGNFVTTIDGAAIVDGGSTAINDKDDKEMFGAIRAVPDFILVGAETVRAENYRPIELDEPRRAARVAAGLDEVPHLVVATRSLSLDPDMRVFGNPERRVTILTDEEAPADRAAALAEVADVVRLNGTSPADLLHYMRVARVVLCEGGPSLMGQLIAAGLVDEMALTISPLLAAGGSVRMAHGPPADPLLEMTLDRILYGDRALFLRYVQA